MIESIGAAIGVAGANWVDLLAALILAGLALRGLQTGLIGAVVNLSSIGVAVWIAVTFQGEAAAAIAGPTGWPAGIVNAIAFIGLLAGGWIGITLLTRPPRTAIETSLGFLPPLGLVNRIAGIVPQVAIGLLVIGAILVSLTAVPISRPLSSAVQASWLGRTILPHLAEAAPIARDWLQALPIDPLPGQAVRIAAPEERVRLDLPDDLSLSIDERAEARMTELINQERVAQGLPPVRLEPTIVPVARAHGRDMFERAYFGHENPDGLAPHERLRAGGVRFQIVGENLAFAPTVERAHTGLMDSPGHRANILRPEFGRVGVGVVRGGLTGTMFTQNFAD